MLLTLECELALLGQIGVRPWQRLAHLSGVDPPKCRVAAERREVMSFGVTGDRERLWQELWQEL